MRLIDADALFPYGAVPYVENDGFATADTLYWIIKNAPTIDPESLRPKGEWRTIREQKYDEEGNLLIDRYTCAIHDDCKCRVYYKTDFCPRCGADMRGEANE